MGSGASMVASLKFKRIDGRTGVELVSLYDTTQNVSITGTGLGISITVLELKFMDHYNTIANAFAKNAFSYHK